MAGTWAALCARASSAPFRATTLKGYKDAHNVERLGAEGDALADHQPLHLSSTALCCEAYLQLMFMVTFVLPLLTFFFSLKRSAYLYWPTRVS